MKFLATSDIHDEEDALERLVRVARKEQVHAVLVCGDITSTSRWFAQKTCESFEQPLFIIPGNNEEKEVLEEIQKHPGYLHGKRTLFERIELAGFGFSNQTPYSTPNELSEKELFQELQKLRTTEKTIVLGHCPPFGSFDLARGRHAGSTAVKAFIESMQPLAYLCGHIHDQEGVSKIAKTTVIKIPAACLYRYSIIETDGTSCSARFGSL